MSNDPSLESLKQAFEKKRVKGNIFFFEETDSTNERVKELYEKQGIYSVAVAKRQSGGRGRNGRSFLSEEGGAYFSLLIAQHGNETEKELFEIVILAGLAVYDALTEIGISCAIKWPNDVLAEGRKICGILALAGYDKYGKRDYVALGIGINVNQKRFEGLEKTAVSVFQLIGKETSVSEIISAVIKRLALYMDGDEEQAMLLYKKRCATLYKNVEVFTSDGSYYAFAEDITEQGYLVVRKQNGDKEIVSFGDVSIRNVVS